MRPTTIIAIYFLLWFLCLFVVLPFGIKTTDEAGIERVPGQADSAPGNFRIGRVVLRTSILAAVLLLLFYLNYVHGWITVHSFDRFFGAPDV